MRNGILAAAFVVSACASSTDAQSRDALVGTWKLVSATNTMENGQVVENAYGQNPTGFLTYTSDGRMMGIISNGGRKPMSAPPVPVQERAEAFSTFLAYAGRYTVSGNRVIHHVEAAWRQDWVNTDQVRFMNLQGNRVTLRTPQLVIRNGARASQELVWERIASIPIAH